MASPPAPGSGPAPAAGDAGPDAAEPPLGVPVDVRGSTGVQVGEGNTQIIYSYNGLTFGDVVAPPPLATFSGRVESPYRGLAAFGEQDAPFFFGREAAAGDVLDRMAERCRLGGVLVVSGTSGAGKSSLLNAGVLPRLRGSGLTGFAGSATWPCLVFTPAALPLDDLAVRLAALCGRAASAVRRELALDPAAFALLARQAALVQHRATTGPGTSAVAPRLVLIVDQFEQVFTQCRDEAQRRTFVAALASAATDEHSPAGLVVLGVRADFEAMCAEQPELVDAVQRRYLVTSMTERQLRMAITEPAKTAGAGVDPDLVDALLLDVRSSRTSASPGTATRVTSAGVLPLVSHALDRAWRTRTGDPLRMADYERTGGVEGAVAASAQHAYDRLTPTQQHLARQVFLRLTVTSADGVHTADRVRVSDLMAGRPEAEQGDVRAVLDAFVEERLLTLAADTVEISHEVLFSAWPLLRDTWLADVQADRIVRARLDATVREWQAHQRDPSYLYSGSLLEAAAATAARIRHDPARHAPLDAPGLQFLSASTAVTRRRTRRRRVVTAALLVLVLAFGASAVLATVAQRSAGHQRDVARATAKLATARLLASTATGELDSDLSQAMLLAARSWTLDHTVEGRAALWQAATASPHLVRFVHLGATATSVAASTDGSAVVVGDAHGRVTVMTPRGQVIRVVRVSSRPVTAVATSSGGTRILATDGRVVDAVTGRRVTRVARPGRGVSTVALSADGAREVYVVSFGYPVSSTVHSTSAGGAGGARRTFKGPIYDAAALSPGRLTLFDDVEGRWFNMSNRLGGPVTHGRARLRGPLYASALAPDGSTIALSNNSDSVPVWRTGPGQPTGSQVQIPHGYGHEPGVVPQTMALSAGGDLMAIADSGSIYVSAVSPRRASAGAPYLATLTGTSRSEVSHLAFAGSDDSRLVSTSADQVAVWDLQQYARIGLVQRARVETSCNTCPGYSVAVSSGSHLAYEAYQFQKPVVHDLADGRDLKLTSDRFAVWGPQLWSISSPTLMLQGFAQGGIAVLDATTGQWRTTWPAGSHKALVYLHWVSGHRLVAVDAADVTTFRDATSGKVLRTVEPVNPLPKHTAPNWNQVSVSDDGRYLATVVSRHVLVSDLRSRRVVARLAEPDVPGSPVTVRFAAGHRLFVFRDGQAQVVRVPSARRLAFVRLSHFLEQPVVDPAGSTIVYQKLNGSLVLVDVRTSREIGRVALPASIEARKSGYDFTPDGKDLLVVTEGTGAYGQVVRLDVSVPALHSSVCRAAGRRLTAAELHAVSPQLSPGRC